MSYRTGRAIRNGCKERGAGLIEVLIAVLITAVGILGVAAMQMAGKRNLYEGTQRSLATGYARDLIERMRGNPDQLATYVTTLGGGSSTRSAGTDCSAAGANCTAAQLAARDLYDIEQAVLGAQESNVGGLVSPTVCIANNAGNVTVTIAWRGAVETSSPGGNNCGEGLGIYGDDDALRRTLTISTFIGEL